MGEKHEDSTEADALTEQNTQGEGGRCGNQGVERSDCLTLANKQVTNTSRVPDKKGKEGELHYQR